MSGAVMRTVELVVAAAVSALLTMIYIVYVGRLLGPAEYSDFSAALSLIYFIAVALTPLTPTLSRITARRTARGEMAAVVGLRRVVVGRLTVGCVAAFFVGALLVRPVAGWLRFRSPWPLLLAVAAALSFAVLSAERGVLQGLMRFRAYNFNLLIESALRLGGAVVMLALLRLSAGAALLSYLVAVMAATLAITVLFAREWRYAEAAAVEWDEVWRLMLPMLVLMGAAALFQNIDMLAVKRWFTPLQAGYYGAASAVARGFGVLFVPLYVMSGPSLAVAHEKKLPVVGPGVRLAVEYALLCLAPLAVLLMWPGALMGAIFGQKFSGSAGMVALVGGLSILLHTGLLLSQVFVTIEDFAFLWVYAVVAVALCIALALFHGSIREIFVALYAAQAVLLAGLAFLMWRQRGRP